MWKQAFAAIFNQSAVFAFYIYGSAAAIFKAVKRTKAKETINMFCLMARIKLAIFIFKILIAHIT